MDISACVVLINDEGLVLGVSRKDDLSSMGLAGGKMETVDNGNPELTAIRETLEETGLRISNLKLVLAIHKDNFMGYTYLADYAGEINHNEPHVVKWVPFETLINGSFGKYNALVAESLTNMGVSFVNEMPISELKEEIKEFVNGAGYLFFDLRRTSNWIGMKIIELTFNHSDGSDIDEDFYDFSFVNKVNEIASKYGVKISIPSDYFPK